MEPRESMRIIEEMVERSRRHYGRESLLYLVWGWLVLTASLLHFVLLEWAWLPATQAWMVWPILMGVGGLLTIIIVRRAQQEKRVKSHIDRSLQYLWSAFAVGLLIILALLSRQGWQQTYPVILVLYGVGSLTSGGILNFRPLQWGGLACFLLSIPAFFLAFQWQLLLLTAAIALGYLIPGHLLQAKFRSYDSA